MQRWLQGLSKLFARVSTQTTHSPASSHPGQTGDPPRRSPVSAMKVRPKRSQSSHHDVALAAQMLQQAIAYGPNGARPVPSSVGLPAAVSKARAASHTVAQCAARALGSRFRSGVLGRWNVSVRGGTRGGIFFRGKRCGASIAAWSPEFLRGPGCIAKNFEYFVRV